MVMNDGSITSPIDWILKKIDTWNNIPCSKCIMLVTRLKMFKNSQVCCHDCLLLRYLKMQQKVCLKSIV